MSNRWFSYRQNRHHVSPNEIDNDPDADLIVLSFSEEQARRKKGVLASLVNSIGLSDPSTETPMGSRGGSQPFRSDYHSTITYTCDYGGNVQRKGD